MSNAAQIVTVLDYPFTVEEFESFKDLIQGRYPGLKIYSLHEE